MLKDITVHLESDLKQRLDRLAGITQRSVSNLGAEALRNFIELNEREICEVEQALIEADNSEFATENNINSILDKWSANSD